MAGEEAGEVPLAGITVLSLTRVRAGPTCARQFADWGADVIMIERPSASGDGLGGARDGSDFQNLHRNKRSLTLDLKREEGVSVLKRLAARADVLMENYRPDVKHRLGIAYDDLQPINPRLVYASISGFGEDGPYSARPGFDQIAQGMGGLMSVTGEPGGGPLRAGIPVADLTAGMSAALGILMALFERQNSGKGRWVATSLLEAQTFMMDFQAARYLVEGEVPSTTGNEHPTSVPTNLFETADGHINVAASGEEIWRRLTAAVGAPELVEDPRFLTGRDRFENRAALNAILAERMKTRKSGDWVALLNDAGVPCGPVNRMDAVFADPQIAHLGMAAPVPEASYSHLVAHPVRIDGKRAPIRAKAPERGAHSREILAAFGFSGDEIDGLSEAKVI